MYRQNEIGSQYVQSLDGETGIAQDGLALRGGVRHDFRAVVRTPSPVLSDVVVRLRAGAQTLAERTFAVRSADGSAWQRLEAAFVAPTDVTATLSIAVRGRGTLVVGVVSLLPADSFRGMRADVIRRLKEIGTSVVRWPGGNFAGEYRWRDGSIADRDERAPLQSYTEIETHPYTSGYDMNDFSTEDILALCDELGAEPFFTINGVWETPESTADWVRQCCGRVRRWSLCNEMGHLHMEGPQTPEEYAKLARRHAEAMRAADPSVDLVSSGLYPAGWKTWIPGAAEALSDVAKTVAFHHYPKPRPQDFTTPEALRGTYANVLGCADAYFAALETFRARLPRTFSISVDEWNLWYAWYREDVPADGLFAVKMMHRFLRRWRQLDLSCACHFQAVNENAIRVTPFESRLTSVGEALRLLKAHVGGRPCLEPADDFFATETADGTRTVTVANFSADAPRRTVVPTGGRRRVALEILEPDRLDCGGRYRRFRKDFGADGSSFEVTLPPAGIASLRMEK